jgi:hypothetical protein
MCDQYSDLLKLAAQACDATFAAQTKTPTWKAYHSNVHADNFDAFYDADDTCDIDSDIPSSSLCQCPLASTHQGIK